MNKIVTSSLEGTSTANSNAESANNNDDAQKAESSEPDSPHSSEQNTTKSNPAGNWFTRLFSRSKNGNGNIRSELNVALTSNDSDSSDFSIGEKTLLRNILLLQDVKVEDIMVPRAEIDAVDIDTTLGELLQIFEQSEHSRLPIYGETLDDPRGMIHIRDLMAYLTTNSTSKRKTKTKSLPNLSKVDLEKEIGKINIMRKVLFVPPSMFAAELMARMQATRTQIALVIDEYGGTDGLISLEDIVEVIVGDIEDEHDDEEVFIKALHKNGAEDGLRCDAKAEIEDIQEALNGNFDVGEHDEDADTIGGVIFSLLGRVPVKGEMVVAFGYEFNIIDADPRRIKTVDMRPAKRSTSRKNYKQ
ncbi:MAG: hemolysin family protein [Nitratireductor sp.]